MSVLFDTCILIDYLNAVAAARDELALHREKYISVITWMEVLERLLLDNQMSLRILPRPSPFGRRLPVKAPASRLPKPFRHAVDAQIRRHLAPFLDHGIGGRV